MQGGGLIHSRTSTGTFLISAPPVIGNYCLHSAGGVIGGRNVAKFNCSARQVATLAGTVAMPSVWVDGLQYCYAVAMVLIAGRPK